MAITEDDFKGAMQRWASGVTIVTSRAGERIHGMTVSDFAGVSLDPPLVLVCADKKSNTLGVVEEGRCFAVNVLAAGQEGLSNRFASRKDEEKRFEGLDLTEGETGAPFLPDCLANIDCTLFASHDAGDHVVLVGRVEQIVNRDLEPLLYYRGTYGGFEDA